nr:PAS domain S-box protein [Sabulibacter ruber]
MEKAPDLLCALDVTGKIIYINDVCEQILGYRSEQLLGQDFIDLVSPKDRAQTKEAFREVFGGFPCKNFINHYTHLSGQEIAISWSAVWSADENIMYGIGRDASDHLAANQKLQEKDEWHKVLVQHGSDMMGLLNEAGEYIYLGETVQKALGYTVEELKGRNVFEFIHPDDSKMAEEFWNVLQHSDVVQVPDVRFRNKKGEWRWIDAIVSNQLRNPAIRAFVISSRDITDRKLATLQVEESERRFRSLFDNNPDLVLYEKQDGTILDANPGFLSLVNLPKEEVISRNLLEFLPEGLGEQCLDALDKAYQGNIVNLNLEIPVEDNPSVHLSITKIPVRVNEKVVGVHSVGKNISEVTRANAIIQKQAETLSTIFESIKDAFYMLDKEWRFRLINTEFERILQLSREECLGGTIWELFPELATGPFYEHFTQAMQTGQPVNFGIYLDRFNKWFDIKAYPSEEGLSVYFSDSTAKVEAQRELEKLSLVASKITNGVIITDAQGRVEWVNEAFSQITGYTKEEVIGLKPSSILTGPESDPGRILQVEQDLRKGVPFNVIFQAYVKGQDRVWVSADVAPVFDEQGAIVQHVAILKDISQRKDAEDKQLQMTNDLYRQNRDLQQFTYIVSHNLRAPVANAMGLSELLTKLDKNSKEYDTSLSYLKTSIFKLDTVLRDLNLILSVRDKQDVMDRETVVLSEVCEQVLQFFQESLANHNGKVNLNLDASIKLHANRAYIYSIFYNLLSNAIKYRAESRPLEVNISCEFCSKGVAHLVFSDNGSGFDMSKAGGNVFKLYKRFHMNKKGRGVGLFLVKTHVESMGGTIEMTSQVNKGTQVSIFLPGAATSPK